MNVVSKLWNMVFMPEWSFKWNCYETTHTWSPYCSIASVDIATQTFKEALKMYSALNLLNFALNKRYDLKALGQNASNTVNSSLFLSANAYFMFSIYCALRLISGKFYYTLTAFIPCFLASYLAIHIERPPRRAALALYLVNIATECIYKICIQNGSLRPIKGAETVIFTVSMSILMYLFRVRGLSNDPISFLVKNLVGVGESRRGLQKAQTIYQECLSNNNQKTSDITKIHRHPTCPHVLTSCINYVATGFGKAFGLSYTALSLLTLSRRVHHLVQKPSRKSVFDILFKTSNLRFGLFMGLFVAVFRGSNCALRRQHGESRDWHAFLAGTLASLTMAISPNPTITTYIMWKCIENSYCVGYSSGLLPDPGRIIPIVYAACVTTIFYCGVLRPGTVRPSYAKFMDRLTDHKIHLVNRPLLAIFRTGAEQGYEDYVPNLDPKFCSRAFLETNLIWML